MARVINTKEVDLLSYWMPLLRKLYEFKQIAIAEEPELRYILEAIDRTLANMFIETADEYGIKRFEDMMGLFPEEGDSLETRRYNGMTEYHTQIRSFITGSFLCVVVLINSLWRSIIQSIG